MFCEERKKHTKRSIEIFEVFGREKKAGRPFATWKNRLKL